MSGRRKIKKSLLLMVIGLLVIGILVTDAFLWAPSRLRVRYETITSTKIPPTMNNYRIVFFSDLHYNNFVNDKRAQHVVDVINTVGAETIIFGGDLFDHPTANLVTPTIENNLIKILHEIEAPYGKFAILGNHDYESATTTAMIMNVLNQSNFEVLINQSIKLHKNTNEFINLIAIDSLSLGEPDITKAFAGTNDEQFNLAVTHAPDLFDQMLKVSPDLVLSAHSHGGQVRFPLFGSLYQPYGAEKYIAGQYHKVNTMMDISNGVGTTKYDVRFDAPAEIIVYRLIYQSK